MQTGNKDTAYSLETSSQMPRS